MTERFYPGPENLGENCKFWGLNGPVVGCNFPKAELMGRLSCEGIIDDVCLFIKDGRPAPSLTEKQMQEIKTTAPHLRPNLPPGKIE